MNTTKTTTSIRIDFDVFIYYKQKQTNLSKMINDFLRGSMLLQEENFVRLEVELEIKEIKEQLNKNNDELTKAHLKLAQVVKQEEEAQNKYNEQLELTKQQARSERLNNPLRYL